MMDVNAVNVDNADTESIHGNIPISSNFGEVILPVVGMEFKSLKKAKELYIAFAVSKGFGIRTRTSRHNFCLFVCHREGNSNQRTGENVKRKSSSMRLGCQASLRVLKDRMRDIWVIRSFNNEHNHEMVSAKNVSHLRCHRNLGSAASTLAEKFSKEDSPTGQVASVFHDSDQVDRKDCWSHVKKVRLQLLDAGDVQAVLDYCRKKKAEESNFFYAIQLDDDSRIVNFFWVDARSRMAYQQVGDVVAFDTTYKRNKYNIPFAPFVGRNHHLQSTLFGCALLQDESETSLVWLFETWLLAMNGKKPVSIVTNQDASIENAVAKVFPDTRHCLYLWQIRKQFPEKLSHLYQKNSTFKHALKRCIQDSSSILEFEEDWQRIIIEYSLEDNEWLRGLYEIRHSWVPVYTRRTFLAGMNTIYRSQSLDAFFDEFVNARTTLREFVIKFDKALDNLYETVNKEDFESRHKQRVLTLGSKLEEHAASIYTRNVFAKFHEELATINRFTAENLAKSGSQREYRVCNSFNSQEAVVVDYNLESRDATCSCQLFEFMGILCRHILVIFQRKNVHQIPAQYILHRWTKEANIQIETGDLGCSTNDVEVLRRMHLQRKIDNLVDLAKMSENAYKLILDGLDSLYTLGARVVFEMHDKDETLVGSNMYLMSDHCAQASNFSVGDQHVPKGREKE